ncbi:MAG TPA: hypothetical protein VMW27_08225, partial [Thermoanaerobaculia bacterium]|nr:hypothetical protein [Thermoanaerobaculia bacterium]
MFRISSRTAVVAAVVLSLSVLAVSPAQAAPLGGTQWLSKAPARWVDSTLSWLSSLLPGNPQSPVQRTTEKAARFPINIGGGPGGGTYTPNTGSCIDPQGNPCAPNP